MLPAGRSTPRVRGRRRPLRPSTAGEIGSRASALPRTIAGVRIDAAPHPHGQGRRWSQAIRSLPGNPCPTCRLVPFRRVARSRPTFALLSSARSSGHLRRSRATGSVARLGALLDRGLADSARLTLLSAPPGYGKTVAVAGWLESRGVAHAWLSLDAADNDLSRFTRYLVRGAGNGPTGGRRRDRGPLRSRGDPEPGARRRLARRGADRERRPVRARDRRLPARHRRAGPSSCPLPDRAGTALRPPRPADSRGPAAAARPPAGPRTARRAAGRRPALDGRTRRRPISPASGVAARASRSSSASSSEPRAGSPASSSRRSRCATGPTRPR